MGSQNKLSKAIEFARAGSSVDDIVQKAGISVDEAKAVVRFHGPNDLIKSVKVTDPFQSKLFQ